MSAAQASPATLLEVAGARLDDVQTRLGGIDVFNGWNDTAWDPNNPALKDIRPTMDRPRDQGGRGPGGALMHQFGGWALSAKDNVLHVKEGTDDTLIEFMQTHGFLHRVNKVGSADQLLDAVRESTGRLLGNDIYGSQFDPVVVNSRACIAEIGNKSGLERWASAEHMLPQIDVDVADGPELERVIRELSENGQHDLYLKTNEGQNGASGVWRFKASNGIDEMLEDARQVVAHRLEVISRLNEEAERAKEQSEHPDGIRTLSSHYVLQRSVGTFASNGSFQVFLDNRKPGPIPVVAASEQINSERGTGNGHYNGLVDSAILEKLRPAISTLVKRVWKAFPTAFGVMKCDYFICMDGRIVMYDIEMRPSGNNPASFYRMHVEKRYSYTPFLRSDWQIRTQAPGTTFSEIVSALGDLIDPDTVMKNRRGVHPIAWNQVSGDGRFVVLAGEAHENSFTDDLTHVRKLEDQVLERLHERFPLVMEFCW